MLCNFHSCVQKATYCENLDNNPSKCFLHSSILAIKCKKFCKFQNCSNEVFLTQICSEHQTYHKKYKTTRITQTKDNLIIKKDH